LNREKMAKYSSLGGNGRQGEEKGKVSSRVTPLNRNETAKNKERRGIKGGKDKGLLICGTRQPRGVSYKNDQPQKTSGTPADESAMRGVGEKQGQGGKKVETFLGEALEGPRLREG